MYRQVLPVKNILKKTFRQ